MSWATLCELATEVVSEHKYLVKHTIRIKGGEDLERKSQTEGNTHDECFSGVKDPASLGTKSSDAPTVYIDTSYIYI